MGIMLKEIDNNLKLDSWDFQDVITLKEFIDTYVEPYSDEMPNCHYSKKLPLETLGVVYHGEESGMISFVALKFNGKLVCKEL